MKLNIAQRNMLTDLADRVTDDKMEMYLDAMQLKRNELHQSVEKPLKYHTSLKVYVHPEHRDLLNHYCTITGETVSNLIRRLTLEYVKKNIQESIIT